MKNKKLLMGAALVSLSAVALPQNAEAINANVNINAKIYTALSVAANTSMDFGVVTRVNTAQTGQITIPANADTVSDNAQGYLTAGGNVSRSKLTVTGRAGANVTLVFPTKATISHTVTAAQTATVAAFDCNTASAGAQRTCTQALAGGTTTFLTGGVLTIPANRNFGDYTGVAAVTINY